MEKKQEKYLYNNAIMENTECSIVKVCTSFINLKVGVLLDNAVLLCFLSLVALWTSTFQAKKNV